jgi:putative copper resistance protein D
MPPPRPTNWGICISRAMRYILPPRRPGSAAWCRSRFCSASRRYRLLEWASLELDVVRRFSILGSVSVATLILSGFVNAWILVGSFRGLVVTGYGQLLMLKLAAFAVMLGFAAFNRFALTPRLALASDDARQAAHRELSRNTLIEIALGLSIFAMVGVLGTQHPAAHLVN